MKLLYLALRNLTQKMDHHPRLERRPQSLPTNGPINQNQQQPENWRLHKLFDTTGVECFS